MTHGSNESTPSTKCGHLPEGDANDSIEMNRKILKDISELYSPPLPPVVENTSGRRLSYSSANVVGLNSIGRELGQDVGLIHRRATVMIMGNISAGKSTFINWYVQEDVQRTGMAIETSGFTYITSGRCLNELGGESTVSLRPFLQKYVTNYKGFLENLSLKTCPSRSSRLQLVDFIDTPGLADGELQYPFDVEEIIYEMKPYIDLYFVFFDPIGQALGKRMLNVVKRLSDICPDKLRFCLSKVDDIRTEQERIKILCQTTQTLTAKINSRHGFDLVPIFVPGAKKGTYLVGDDVPDNESCNTVNRIGDLIDDISRVTERKVQDSLNGLKLDIQKLRTVVEKVLESDSKVKSTNSQQAWESWRRFFFRCFLLVVIVCVGIVHMKAVSPAFDAAPASVWLRKNYKPLDVGMNEAGKLIKKFSFGFEILWIVLIGLFMSTVSLAQSTRPVSLTKQQLGRLLEYREFLSAAKAKWSQLNQIYLEHTVE